MENIQPIQPMKHRSNCQTLHPSRSSQPPTDHSHLPAAAPDSKGADNLTRPSPTPPLPSTRGTTGDRGPGLAPPDCHRLVLDRRPPMHRQVPAARRRLA